MMRALWTAGSGMIGQQTNVDIIANNLANVNTTAYKKTRAEFKDLLYETMQRAYILDGNGRPANLQVGHGATPIATVRNFAIGNLEKTDNPLDLAIDGNGFFALMGPAGTPVYTKDGSFKLSLTEQGPKLTTAEGYSVLDEAGQEIYISISADKLNISETGELSTTDENGVPQSLGQRIAVVNFANRAGLESIGGNMYAQTSASGGPVTDEEIGTKSIVRQYFLESSNVQVVEEMVKLIVAQRAYEINSKSIQTADEMLGMANNLRR